ncbi:MAG: hypothetical protein K2K97_03045 [Muribaculaceae bacterium]|nr:hypothetical protein [Muribaculaceae bacterium]
MSYIGKIGASRLDPEDILGLENALRMVNEGYDPVVVKVNTGWERGIDGLWRYEIPDPFLESSLIEDYVKPRFGMPVNIRLILSETSILEAYPELSDLALYAMYSPRKGAAGYYSPASRGMVVSMGTKSDDFEYQIEGILLHEIQHLIQEIEGFACGGDPKALGRRRYHRLAGEVEARNICHRHSLAEEERRRSLRTSTQDVPDREQIILFH